MDKFYWPRLERNSVRALIGVLILLSLGTVHYTTFSYSIPPGLRPLLDLSFKTNFISSFFLVATFSLILARYVPQFFLAVAVFLRVTQIEYFYYNRGYRTVPVGAALFREGRMWDRAKRRSYTEKLSRFGRQAARFDNFIADKVQLCLPVLWYEEAKYRVTALLAGFLLLLQYVGFNWALWLLAASALSASSLSSYLEYSDAFRFRMSGHRFRGDDPNYKPTHSVLNSEEFFVYSVVLAIVIAVAGPIRFSKLTSEYRVSMEISGDTRSASVIGSTSGGLLVFDGQYHFVPFVEVGALNPKPTNE